MPNQKYLIILFGPTGVGKTDLSIEIAQKFKAEIFSCDSRQIYKELNIGVAKPDANQLKSVKHHFIDYVSVHNHYSIYQYEADSIKALDKYFENNDIALMVGGSGLYIDAVINGVDEMPDPDPEIRKNLNELFNENGLEALRFELKKHDPVYYEQVDLKNPQRIIRALEMFYLTGKPFSEFRKNHYVKRSFDIIKIGIDLDREKLYYRINLRVDNMISDGLVQEAYDLYHIKNLTALKTIGYRELFDYIEKKCSLEDAIELIKKNTRNYAKRQLTWFRRYSDTNWFSPGQKTEIINFLNEKVNNNK
jgi:tRNA dimethylallyltransferase